MFQIYKIFEPRHEVNASFASKYNLQETEVMDFKLKFQYDDNVKKH